MSLAGDNKQVTSKRMPKIWQWLCLVSIILFLILAALYINSSSGIVWLDGYHSFPQAIKDMGWWGQLGIIGLMIIHCFVPFPAEFVALAAGSVYGTIHGTILTWIGAMIGAMISFALTRKFGQPFVSWALPERQQCMLDQWTKDQGAFTLLVSRFIPVIAFNLINYAAGLTKITWWTFFWTTGVGILPLTALMVYMGNKMQELSWTMLIVTSFVCIVSMALIHLHQRQKIK